MANTPSLTRNVKKEDTFVFVYHMSDVITLSTAQHLYIINTNSIVIALELRFPCATIKIHNEYNTPIVCRKIATGRVSNVYSRPRLRDEPLTWTVSMLDDVFFNPHLELWENLTYSSFTGSSPELKKDTLLFTVVRCLFRDTLFNFNVASLPQKPLFWDIRIQFLKTT